MKYKYLFLLAFLVTTTTCLYSQQAPPCDTVMEIAENMPYYQNGMEATTQFIITELAPVFTECKKKGGEIDTRIYLKLTINTQGQVADMVVSKGILPDWCRDELKKKILNMSGWAPGKMNGEPVCCKVILPISIEEK